MARRNLAAAMVAIGRAEDPEETYRYYENRILSALEVLGPDHPLARALREQCPGGSAAQDPNLVK